MEVENTFTLKFIRLAAHPFKLTFSHNEAV